MADSFTYGDYTLSFVHTVGFTVDGELDPSSTERLWNRYTITVQGVIATGLAPGKIGETAADTLRRIREEIMMPRQYLLYGQNGKAVVLPVNFPLNVDR